MSDPYEVEMPPSAPGLPGLVVVRGHADDVIDELASSLTSVAVACVRAMGDFHLALSGGSTPLPLYRRLMLDPTYRHLPWERTHLWIVDERRVPFEDERSNYRQIHDLIVEHAGIPKSQVHPMRATEDRCDERYEAELRSTLEWRRGGQQRLDYVVLGMGGDGHTASLFPRSRALRDASSPARDVLINSGPEVTPPDRVTMTQHLINKARHVSVLVTGSGKREMIGKVAKASGLKSRAAEDELPILSIRPQEVSGGELAWFLDHDACPR
jgi:6-phosphogluconolactonase